MPTPRLRCRAIFTTRHGWTFGVESRLDGRALLLQWSHLRDRKYARLI